MGLLCLVAWLAALLLCARADFVGQYPSVLGVTPSGATSPVVAVASYDILNGVLRFDPAVGGAVAAYKATGRTYTGEYLSTAIVNGNPAAAFFDAFNGDLGYVRANNPGGTSWGSPVYPDTFQNVGMYTSLKVLSTSPPVPAIAYQDNSHYSGALKFVRASDNNGGGWNSPVTVQAGNGVGQHASLAVVQGQPAIAYYSLYATTLFYIRASDAQGDKWPTTPVTIDSTAGVYVTLAVGTNGPVVVYTRESDGALFFARAQSADGATWLAPVRIAEAAGQKVRFPSLLILDSGIPAVAYATQPQSDVVLRLAGDVDGTTWPATAPNTQTVATGRVCGGTSIAKVGVPVVAIYDSQQGWIYLRFATDAAVTSLSPTLFLYDKGLSYVAAAAGLVAHALLVAAVVALAL